MDKENDLNIYDSIFSFIFSVQEKKKNKPFPKSIEGMSDYASALIEIGTQPLLYPLESAFNAINSSIARGTSVDLGGGVSAGLGSGAFMNPTRYSKSEVSKNRAKARWASIGGSLHYAIDGALISLYARSNGASSRTAYEAGILFKELLKEEIYSGYKYPAHRIFGSDSLSKEEIDEKSRSKRNDQILGYRSKEEILGSEEEFFNKAVQLRASTLSRLNHKLSKSWLIANVHDLQKEPSKNERIKKTAQLLSLQGLDMKEGLDVGYSLWGSAKSSDLGLFRVGDEVWKSKKEELSKDYNLNNQDIGKIEYYRGIEDIKEREKAIYFFLKNEKDLDPKIAFNIAKEISNIQINDGNKIAKDSIYWSLAADITEKLKKDGNYADIPEVKKRVESILEPSSKSTLGMKVERGILIGNWLANSGSWGSVLVDGNWEKFGVEDINFTKIVEPVSVKKDGEEVGVYYKGANSVIGRLLGDFYYFHPNNLIKGLFIDGSLWLKWACDKQGNLNTKSFAYLMNQLSLNNLLSFLMKPFKGLTNNVVKIINPFFEGAKKFLKGFFTKMLGATGIGGVLVNLLMNVVSDKFAYVINQIVMVVVLGAIGIVFVIFDASGVMYSNRQINTVKDEDEESSQVVVDDGQTFTDEDFDIDTTDN